MISIDELAARVRANFPNADLDVLRRAYELSVREHQGQRRQSGEPYVSHPIEVAQILCDLHLDMACICAGLLHDVVEDAGTPIELIRDSFGDEIAHMVAGVTKLSRMQYSSQKERQAESFRRLLLAVVDDLRVLLVKLADRLHNMRTLEHLPLEKGRAIAQETLEIYAPIAHRLGMSRIRGELEDLAFKYVDPAAYRSLEGQLARKKASTDKSTREVIRTLEDRLKEEGIEARIETRVKRVHSTYEKLRTRKLSLDQVFDFIALRVLVASERDCYVVLGVVNNMWKPVPGRIKDFIAMPRANMYQSIHTTVLGPDGHPFEVQIRTAAMHRVAEEGIAAHWKYKEGKVAQEKDDKRFGWLRQLLEWNREVSDPHQFLSNLKIDLYPEEVYVFTPKREVVALPRGATPVDFAYAIHTEVGHRCVGAKVNGRIVPLKHRLVNGEIVEILTAGDANPSKDWLNFVRTARARNAIRRSINLRLREEAVEVGRRLLEKEARRFQLNLKKYQDKLETVPATFGRSKLEELYADVGYGKVPARRILQCLAPELSFDQQPAVSESKWAAMVRKVLQGSDTAVEVRGYDDLLVFRAKCCSPIRGEEVAGYLVPGRGVAVHSTNCPDAENLLLDPERRVEVRWTDSGGQSRFPVRLSITTEDRTGMLAAVATAISNARTNIVSVQARVAGEGCAQVDVTIEIADARHLETVTDSLKELDGVRNVERVKTRPRETKR